MDEDPRIREFIRQQRESDSALGRYLRLREGLDVEAKRQALERLATAGGNIPGGGSVVEEPLVADARDPDRDVRFWAYFALVRVSEPGPMIRRRRIDDLLTGLPPSELAYVVERLLRELDDDSGFRKRGSVIALGRLGTSIPHQLRRRTVDRLLQAESESPKFRPLLAEALARMGAAIPDDRRPGVFDFLLQLTDDGDWWHRYHGWQAVTRLRPVMPPEKLSVVLSRVVRDFTGRAANRDAWGAEDAALWAPHLAAEARRMLTDHLVLLASDPANDDDARWRAAEAILRLRCEISVAALDLLVHSLLERSRDPRAHEGDPRSLGRLARRLPADKRTKFVTELMRRAWPSDLWRSTRVPDAIAMLGKRLPSDVRPSVVGFLVGALDGSARDSAMDALGRLRAGIPEDLRPRVVDRLVTLGDTPDRRHGLAVSALGNLGTAIPEGRRGAVTELLLRAAVQSDSEDRRRAAAALGNLRGTLPKAARAEVVGRLLEMTRDPEVDVAQRAVSALGRLKGVIPEDTRSQVVARLLALGRFDNREMQRRAGNALTRLGSVVPGPQRAEVGALLGEVGQRTHGS